MGCLQRGEGRARGGLAVDVEVGGGATTAVVASTTTIMLFVYVIARVTVVILSSQGGGRNPLPVRGCRGRGASDAPSGGGASS